MDTFALVQVLVLSIEGAVELEGTEAKSHVCHSKHHALTENAMCSGMHSTQRKR